MCPKTEKFGEAITTDDLGYSDVLRDSQVTQVVNPQQHLLEAHFHQPPWQESQTKNDFKISILGYERLPTVSTTFLFCIICSMCQQAAPNSHMKLLKLCLNLICILGALKLQFFDTVTLECIGYWPSFELMVPEVFVSVRE